MADHVSTLALKVKDMAHTCSECGERFIVWWEPPGNKRGPKYEQAKRDAEQLELPFVVSVWNPSGPAPPTFQCPNPECGADLLDMGSLN